MQDEKRKRKKSKPTEKYNITPDFEKFHFYKNGNIKKNVSEWLGVGVSVCLLRKAAMEADAVKALNCN